MSEFKTWDSYTEVEKLQCVVSDTYKDHFNVRPRHYTPEQWSNKEFLKKELDWLYDKG
jgi:hypothetical protein